MTPLIPKGLKVPRLVLGETPVVKPAKPVLERMIDWGKKLLRGQTPSQTPKQEVLPFSTLKAKHTTIENALPTIYKQVGEALDQTPATLASLYSQVNPSYKPGQPIKDPSDRIVKRAVQTLQSDKLPADPKQKLQQTLAGIPAEAWQVEVGRRKPKADSSLSVFHAGINPKTGQHTWQRTMVSGERSIGPHDSMISLGNTKKGAKSQLKQVFTTDGKLVQQERSFHKHTTPPAPEAVLEPPSNAQALIDANKPPVIKQTTLTHTSLNTELSDSASTKASQGAIIRKTGFTTHSTDNIREYATPQTNAVHRAYPRMMSSNHAGSQQYQFQSTDTGNYAKMVGTVNQDLSASLGLHSIGSMDDIAVNSPTGLPLEKLVEQGKNVKLFKNTYDTGVQSLSTQLTDEVSHHNALSFLSSTLNNYELSPSLYHSPKGDTLVRRKINHELLLHDIPGYRNEKTVTTLNQGRRSQAHTGHLCAKHTAEKQTYEGVAQYRTLPDGSIAEMSASEPEYRAAFTTQELKMMTNLPAEGDVGQETPALSPVLQGVS
ncbi:MAG: hypothetical protein ACKO37_01705 [Vampirovibrionales bacterium]